MKPKRSASGTRFTQDDGLQTLQNTALVALIDDHPATRDALVDLLDAMDIPSRAFGSAEEFLRSPERGKVTCLVLDVSLPGMSGLDLQVRLAACGHVVPIVFLTSMDSPQVRDRALASGASCFLLKPVEGRTLLEWLERLA